MDAIVQTTRYEPVSKRRWKVLLVSANVCSTPEPVFPLGLSHINAALRRAGHVTRWLDLLFEGQQFEHTLAEFCPDAIGISIRNIDDVLIGKRETFVDGLQELVGRLHRQPGLIVILGGSGFSIFPRDLMNWTGADYGIIGEGEKAVVDLLDALSKGGDLHGIPALLFRKDGELVSNAVGKGGSGVELEVADWPARLVSRYLQGGGMLNLQTQRGCAHRCCYCTYPVIEGRNHRSRSIESVVSEFEKVQHLGASYAFVADSVFNSSAQHVRSVCEELLRRDVKVRWGCFLRPQGLTRELMRLMARAGLTHIEFGSDSFCDEVLQAYGKDFTFRDVLCSSDLAREQAIDFCHFMIAGGPGETYQTLQTSFENSRLLQGAIIMAVPGMRIYPGTNLYNRARAEGVVGSSMDLLKPAYYLAPGLELEAVVSRLNSFARLAPNWIAGSFNPGYEQLVTRLRQRGVTGPLWSYFATAQRLWPVPSQQ